MTPLQLIMVALNGLSVLVNNPAIGGSNLKFQEASELLSILSLLITRGEEGYEDLKAFAEEIQKMVDENRGPTPTEWKTMRARSDVAHETIQKARRAAEARQELADELDALEAISEEDLTEEQSARLGELTSQLAE